MKKKHSSTSSKSKGTLKSHSSVTAGAGTGNRFKKSASSMVMSSKKNSKKAATSYKFRDQESRTALDQQVDQVRSTLDQQQPSTTSSMNHLKSLYPTASSRRETAVQIEKTMEAFDFLFK